MTALLNGQRRPSLNDQIHRLDRILDGLAEGLNESVATAVQEAVVTAVKAATETVLRELLNSGVMNPALAAAMTPPAPKLPMYQRIGNACRWLWRKAIAVVKALPSTTCNCVKRLVNGVGRAVSATRRATLSQVTRSAAAVVSVFVIVWRLRRSVPIAITAGLGAAALGYSSTPELTALLHGMTVATLALMGRLVAPVRRPRVSATRS